MLSQEKRYVCLNEPVCHLLSGSERDYGTWVLPVVLGGGVGIKYDAANY